MSLLEPMRDEERGRMLETARRLASVERQVFVLAGIAAAIAIPKYGIAPLLTTVLAGLFVTFAHLRVKRYRRPERVLIGAWMLAQLALAAGIGFAHGDKLFLLGIMVMPVMLTSVIFPARFVGVNAAWCVAYVLGLTLFAWHDFLTCPPVMTYPLVTIIGTAIIASRVRDLDAESRSTAVVDRLTGLLNRAALTPRVAELEHQSSVTGEQVAMIVCDVDRFKAINDEHGHAAGDAVLKEIAQRVQTALGTFESIYRLGGEEFIVLLTGTSAPIAGEVAERLRQAVRETPIDGHKVTISFGVAASPPGRFQFEATFAEADSALYEAKRGGRDRVRLITGPGQIMRNGVLAPASRSTDFKLPDGTRTRPVPAPAPATPPAETWEQKMAFRRKTTGTWLVRDDVERDHLLDLAHRARSTHSVIYPLVFGALLLAGPWLGWLGPIPPFIGFLVSRRIGGRVLKFKHPDLALGAAWMVSQTGSVLGYSLIYGHNPPISVIVMMTLAVTSFSAMFPARGIAFGVGVTTIYMLIGTLAFNSHMVFHDPVGLIYAWVALCVVALVGRAIGASATDHRNAAVVDQLTGMLNRVALEARVAELAHQAATTGGQVALIIGDLDHFKSVNDEHGHSVGDAVLRDVAYRLRSDLRAFESAYRIGGEEFVILLAGTDAQTAGGVAERLRLAVHTEPAAGVDVTMSFGVAASERGEPFDYTEVFRRADTVLYAAKDNGRDQVIVDGAVDDERQLVAA